MPDLLLVALKPLLHGGKECIGIFFEINHRIQAALQKTGLVKFSSTHKCWYALLSKENYNKLFFALKGLATIEQSALHAYLAEKKKKQSGGTVTATTLPFRPVAATVSPGKPRHPVSKDGGLSPINAHVLRDMRQQLLLKAYSPSTLKTYLNEMAQFLSLLHDHPADKLSPAQLKRYLVYCYEKLGLKENTLHSRINAMKFYYEQVLGRERFFWEIPRPKKQQQLPYFFNQDEVTAIIKAAGNHKHRTMLMLCYGCGLRVSEVVRLQAKDIDSGRMSILIRQAKGKKDRIVPLSPVLLIMLREYWKKNKLSKEGFLFLGQDKAEPYSTRSLQLVLAAAKKKAGILKPGSIHALRHSFATHLLDKGTDVTMIMKLLGHNDLKTTLRYLHTSNRDLLQIVSPLDDLKL